MDGMAEARRQLLSTMQSAVDGAHPVALVAPSLAVLRRRANLAMFGLGAAALARVWDIAARQLSLVLVAQVPQDGGMTPPDLMAQLLNADRIVGIGNSAIAITFFVTAVLFLRWTHRLAVVARELRTGFTMEPATAVVTFIIPILSLWRPYQLFTGLGDALAPDRVAPPAPHVDPAQLTDYRTVAFVAPAATQRLPEPWIAAWWASYLIMSIGTQILRMGTKTVNPEALISRYHDDMLASAIAVLAAALAVTVVRGLTARAEERFRRMRASTPEALGAQGIDLR